MRVLIALLAAVVTLPGFGNIPGAGGFQQWSGMAGANEDRTDYRILISDLLTGQYDHPLRVVAFNPLEGWSRDASEDVAHELEQRVAEGHEVTEEVARVHRTLHRPANWRATVVGGSREF